MSEEASRFVDVTFPLRGRAVALDYAERLWDELVAAVPELEALAGLAVHPLAGVSRGDTEIYFTRRARLSLRLPVSGVALAQALVGRAFDLGGAVEVSGAPTARELMPSRVLYSPFVSIGETDERQFLPACLAALAALSIQGELIVGRAQQGCANGRQWHGYSLMVHELKPEQSLVLQQHGLGHDRRYGCGIFVPHKSLAAVDE